MMVDPELYEPYERPFLNDRAAFYRTLYQLNKPVVDQLTRLWHVVRAHGLSAEVMALAPSPPDDPPAASASAMLVGSLAPAIPVEPAPNSSAGNVLNPRQVADLYNVSIDVVYNWLHTGILPAVDLSTPGSQRRRYGIRREDLKVFENRRSIQPPPRRRPRRQGRPKDYKDFYA